MNLISVHRLSEYDFFTEGPRSYNHPMKSSGIRILFTIILTILSVSPIFAQRADPDDPANIALGRELLGKVIAARGGSAYSGIRTVTATGQYTPFDRGMSQVPIPFLDIIVYPDRERVEFGKGKKKDRRIQVNVGAGGWLYDGENEVLKDQSAEQLKSYADGLEYDIDRILRGEVANASVRFFGREELRPGERADVVLIEPSPTRSAYLWLDRKDHLPIKLIYEKSSGGTLTRHEVRFFQYVRYDGVLFPNIVDFLRDGVQESRVNYQSIRLNQPVNDDIFAKPVNVKAIK